MRKIFIFAVILSLTITSCQKETKSVDNKSLKAVQSETNLMAGLKAKAVSYRATVDKTYPLVLAKRNAALQNIDKLMLERKQYRNKQAVISGAHLNRESVIHVPGDYSTLQAAVDNSMDGGKIIVDGTLLQSGNVMVDVPNLTIQGEGEDEAESSTINDYSIAGDNLVVTVPGVTIKNLTLLNLGIAINNSEGTKLINVNAVNSNPGIFSVIGLFGSNNNIVKNCKISGGSLTGGSAAGIFLDDFSNNNEVDNCIVSNTQEGAFGIEGSNNQITNCEAVNFNRGFTTFDGVATGNIFKECVASHSYADIGFLFLNFTTNNTTVTLKNCTANDNLAFASILVIGGSVIISNCTANSSVRNIAGNTPQGITVIGVGQTGELASVSNCTANSNANGGIGIINMNFQVTNNTCNKNLALDPTQGAILALISDNGLPMSGTVKGNTTDFNANNAIGLFLAGITNSSITNNESMNNAVCDFNQTNCSGNTLTNNKFGTSCTGL